MKSFTHTRLAGGRMLGGRAAAAAYAHRHVNVVRRYCEPVACDAETRALLFDLEETCELLGKLRRVA